jgi:hypothetical protein
LRRARLDDDLPQKMQKQSKRQRQSKRRKRLKMRAPPKPNLRMEIYNDSNGVVTHLTWRTEETYRAVAAFLKDLPGQGGLIPGDPEKPAFYIVETQQQMDAFWAFAQALSKAQH